jgi:hypothetical protein
MLSASEEQNLNDRRRAHAQCELMRQWVFNAEEQANMCEELERDYLRLQGFEIPAAISPSRLFFWYAAAGAPAAAAAAAAACLRRVQSRLS